MPNLTKEDFIFLIQKKLEKQLDKRCIIDAEKDILKVLICGCPYMDIKMSPLYWGYCFDVFPLDKIESFIFKAINGYDIPEYVFNSLITIHEPSAPETKCEDNDLLPDSLSEITDINCNFEFIGKIEENEDSDEYVKCSFTVSEVLEKVSFTLEYKDTEFINEKSLYRRIHDIYLIYTLPSEDGKRIYSIDKESLNVLNLTEKDIHKAALNNFLKKHSKVTMKKRNLQMDYFEVSCDSDYNGAAPFLLPGVLKSISEKLNSNLYIVPICKQHFYVHRSTEDIRSLYAGLRKALTVIPNELKLSESVFYYSKAHNSLTYVDKNGQYGDCCNLD